MRSARMLLATGAVSAVLALGAPAAHAYGGDGDQSGSSWSHDGSSGHDSSSYTKDHDEDGHGRPHGGMHTGGGALAAVKQDGGGRDPRFDPDTYKDKDNGSGSWGGGHEKPHGGMHTGGGALADPGVTAGGVAVLAVAGAGLYLARRRKTAAGLA
ncbi:hypothetical protein [Streptomyces gilvus]|uniref:hypothetical protein n=1 Tax=Streptomyces gilvus TaxID=2920937 RepID=UPI001F116ED2|nr:hypothetical protein [Streptomyces sp. CME 23]MCH5677220.1 hypothetical protein [Streptomyces sp. CME 23]